MISKALVQAKSITPEPGGDGRDRTGDLHVANVALSRLSYIPVIKSPEHILKNLKLTATT